MIFFNNSNSKNVISLVGGIASRKFFYSGIKGQISPYQIHSEKNAYQKKNLSERKRTRLNRVV